MDWHKGGACNPVSLILTFLIWSSTIVQQSLPVKMLQRAAERLMLTVNLHHFPQFHPFTVPIGELWFRCWSCSLNPSCCLMWFLWSQFSGQMTDQALIFFSLQLQQKSSIWSERLGSVKVLFAWWGFLTFDLGRNTKKRNVHPLQKKYGSSEQPQGDARIQECADFRCGEWQPWWSSDCCSVVIENTFPSAGETRSVSKTFGEPQQM